MEQQRNDEGLFLDPISFEPIPKELEVRVGEFFFSIETLYLSYAKMNKLENPFTREPLSPEIQEKVLEYSRSQCVQVVYSGKTLEYQKFTEIGILLRDLIYLEDEYKSQDLCVDNKSFFNSQFSDGLFSFGMDVIEIKKTEKIRAKKFSNFASYLEKLPSSGKNDLVIEILEREQTNELKKVINSGEEAEILKELVLYNNLNDEEFFLSLFDGVNVQREFVLTKICLGEEELIQRNLLFALSRPRNLRLDMISSKVLFLLKIENKTLETNRERLLYEYSVNFLNFLSNLIN